MDFALRIIRLAGAMPRSQAGQVIGRQRLRAGSSVGANYRAACRARSRADFAAKMGIVEEEADEALYWLELLVRSGLMELGRVEELMKEANEIVAIVTASRKTAQGKIRRESNGQSSINNRQSQIHGA